MSSVRIDIENIPHDRRILILLKDDTDYSKETDSKWYTADWEADWEVNNDGSWEVNNDGSFRIGGIAGETEGCMWVSTNQIQAWAEMPQELIDFETTLNGMTEHDA